MSEKLPLFVWGTLREGHGNWNWLLKGNTEGHEEATLPNYKMYPVGLMIFKDEEESGNYCVRGEVHYVKDSVYEEVLNRVDGLESYNPKTDTGAYLRRKETVQLDSGESVEAWVYVNSHRNQKHFIDKGYEPMEVGIR